MKNLFIIIAATSTFLVLTSQTTFALYRWTDEVGQVHISDTPNPSNPSNNEVISDQVYKSNNKRPANANQSQPYSFTVGQPSQASSPGSAQMPSFAPIAPAPAMIPPHYDEKAAQHALEQALEPLATLMAKILLIGFIHLSLFMLTLISIMKSEFTNNTNKILWVIIVLALPVLGVLLYFLIEDSSE